MSVDAIREWNSILEGSDLSSLCQRLDKLALHLDLGKPFADFVGRSTALSQALMEYFNRVNTEYIEEIIYYLLDRYPVDRSTIQDYVSHCPDPKLVEEVLKRWEGGRLSLQFIGVSPGVVEVLLGFGYVDLSGGRLTPLEILLSECDLLLHRGNRLKKELKEIIQLLLSSGNPPPCLDTIQETVGIDVDELSELWEELKR